MDLTTLARAKAYLGGNMSTQVDAVLTPLISRASDHVMQWTGRKFQRSTYTNARLNGTGTARLMLPDNPIISVSALSIDDVAYSLTTSSLSTGYQYDTKFIVLTGGMKFSRGLRNVTISWSAGYTTSESNFVPANPGPYTLTPVTGSGLNGQDLPADTSGPAVVDRGVTYANGTALVKVGSAPAAGQYSFSGGVYTFAAADAGMSVTMSYDFVPGAVEQGVLELMGAAFERRKNLGVASRTLDRETVVYDQKMMTKAVKELLGPYRFVISP